MTDIERIAVEQTRADAAEYQRRYGRELSEERRVVIFQIWKRGLSDGTIRQRA